VTATLPLWQQKDGSGCIIYMVNLPMHTAVQSALGPGQNVVSQPVYCMLLPHPFTTSGVLVSCLLRLGAKVSVAHMYGYQHQPVPVVSLAPGWAIDNAYIGRDRQYLTYNPNNRTWPCVD
jgi:hypothetical protein